MDPVTLICVACSYISLAIIQTPVLPCRPMVKYSFTTVKRSNALTHLFVKVT
jgi:hypothetical protein